MEDKDFKDLYCYIITFFSNFFGITINNSEFIVFNDPKAECPMFITNTIPLGICTCVEPGYWSQFIYQFSHELTHYIIYSNNKEKEKQIKWFEETICEAMSLFTLNKISENWMSTPLYVLNKN